MLCSKTYFEKKLFIPLYHEVLFTIFMQCRMFGTPKLNLRKYTNYDMIKIYINTLSTLNTEIFMATEFSIMNNDVSTF